MQMEAVEKFNFFTPSLFASFLVYGELSICLKGQKREFKNSSAAQLSIVKRCSADKNRILFYIVGIYFRKEQSAFIVY